MDRLLCGMNLIRLEFKSNMCEDKTDEKGEVIMHDCVYHEPKCEINEAPIFDLSGLSPEHTLEIEELILKYKEEDKESWLEEYCNSWHRSDGLSIKQYQVDSITSFAKEFIDRCRLEMEEFESPIYLGDLTRIAKEMGVDISD